MTTGDTLNNSTNAAIYKQLGHVDEIVLYSDQPDDTNIVNAINYPIPESALALERVPETVLEKAVGPAARTVTFLADAARSLQHGRLHLYILYVFLGVTALGMLVFQGGM